MTTRFTQRKFRFLSVTLVILALIPVTAETAEPGPSHRRHPEIMPAAAAAGATPSWWREAQLGMQLQEYEIGRSDKGLQAPNRAQNLRTCFFKDGIEVMSRITPSPVASWRFTWRTTWFGRENHRLPVGAATQQFSGARVNYAYSCGLCEWYVNRPEGIEQGFRIESSPEGEGRVVVGGVYPEELRAELSADGQTIEFMDQAGVPVIHYAELYVQDRDGRILPSTLAVSEGEIHILIDDRGAAYPLEIDPLMTAPNWITESDQAHAFYGFSVSTAGDVDGDGYSDVIVGSPDYDHGEYNEGRVFLYLGSENGLSITPAWTAESDQASASFGHAVATAGDSNNDGFGDVVVGAPFFDNGEEDEGRVFLYYGSASGPSATPDWIDELDYPDSRFGYAVSTAGDINADGYDDLIVGAPWWSFQEPEGGYIKIYLGSPAGPDSNLGLSQPQAGAHTGISVATAGDVNGDGYDDLIYGIEGYSNDQVHEGRALLKYGSASGPVSSGWLPEGNQDNAQFGHAVAPAGDVNGDGYADIIVGAYLYDNDQADEGRAYLFLGSVDGPSATADWMAEGDMTSTSFGHAVAPAGDVNGDGYADVIIGACTYNSEGRAFVYLGSSGGLADTADWFTEGNQGGSGFGFSVCTAGDVNGDGFSDIVVGASAYDHDEVNEGRVYLYHGAADGLAATAGWTGEGDQSDSQFGWSVSSAGDVNGDGHSDVIVGVPGYDSITNDEGRASLFLGTASGLSITPAWVLDGDQVNGCLGWTVSSAGDVNADGYCDVIVGIPFYDNTLTDQGRALLFLGSPGGLSSTADWIYDGAQEDGQFASSVANAGDVNGDGFGDVIVGARNYGFTSNEGAAFVYHGYSNGLYESPSWLSIGEQPGSYFGVSVSSAGDVNGDRCSDVIIGAHLLNLTGPAEGGAYVYLGAPGGLADSPVWAAYGEQVECYFGGSVANAGDVNGDGYGDIIVGAAGYGNGEEYEGRAYVYFGSEAGPSSTPDWIAEPDQGSAFFGRSVASAGDVNGDGYSDVIVGANGFTVSPPAYGAVFLYRGSPTGPGLTPSWMNVSSQPWGGFGWSVASAGDVNGDGYSDVIAGTPGFGNYTEQNGYAQVYLGNNRTETNPGLPLCPHQRTTSLFGPPVALLGRSDSEEAFRIHVAGRSAAGRTNVRMEYNVALFGSPLALAPLTSGDWFGTGTPIPGEGSQTLRREYIEGLEVARSYHWRMRVAGKSPYFPRTPWFTQSGSVPSEKQFRTGGGLISDVIPPDYCSATTGLSVRSNPFTPGSAIDYALPVAGRVVLSIYDAAGRQVTNLLSQTVSAGPQVVYWNGCDRAGVRQSPGIYFARLEVMGEVQARKLILTW
jgi:FG-GAP repeat